PKICAHLPPLPQRSRHGALVRSLTHKNNGHQEGTYLMLTGRTNLPSTFKHSRPQGSDWPSIAAIAGDRRPVASLGAAVLESAGEVGPARQHEVGPFLVPVVLVGQRTDQGPVAAPLGQGRQVRADLW